MTESVWDYPRPPRIEPEHRPVRVLTDSAVLAVSSHALRVLETSHPPTIYIPPLDVDFEVLEYRAEPVSVCEWKGAAHYYLLDGVPIGWTYHHPRPAFEALTDYVAFYPGRVEAWLGGERVTAQDGDFYGGWITADIIGPFKGAVGTLGW